MRGTLLCAGLLLACNSICAAAADESRSFFSPVNLALESEPESVYAPPAPPRADEGLNQGAVHFELSVDYFTDYVFRGVEILEPPGPEDRANLQINSRLTFDLGKLPHPFIGVFVNDADSDPVSRFQTIQPSFGADWFVRPFVLTAGHTTYLFPDRDELETSEVFGKIQLDDSYFLHTDEPLLSPYIFAAYDYDSYDGWYFEAGVSHDFIIEGTGLTLTASASVSYILGYELFETAPGQPSVTGFQHYQVGLVANYSLNTLLNFSQRYGEFSFQGFIYYTDGIQDDLAGDSQVYGGAGISFKY